VTDKKVLVFAMRLGAMSGLFTYSLCTLTKGVVTMATGLN